MAQKILKKLTLATLVGDKNEMRQIAMDATPQIPDPDKEGKFILAPTGPAVRIATILGHVTSIKPGEHKETGTQFVKLFGSFEGTNLVTGEVVPDVGLCLLPNFVSTSIAAAINSGAENVVFGVTMLVKYSAKSAVGYEYEAETLLPAQASTAIQSLKAQLVAAGVALPAPGEVKAIAAPKPTSAPRPAPAPAAKFTPAKKATRKR